MYVLLNKSTFYLTTRSLLSDQVLVCLFQTACLPASSFNSNTIGLEDFFPTILLAWLYYRINQTFASMPPRSPVQAGENKKYRAWGKHRIIKINKRRKITVKDKSHYSALERVHIKIMSIHVEKLSIAHNTTLERVIIQHWLIDWWLITT